MEYKIHMPWHKLMVVKDSGRPIMPRYKVQSSKDIQDIMVKMSNYYSTLDREEFVIIGLDGKNKTMFYHSVSVGCLTSSIVHPREVFKMAIVSNAAALILTHNHPSGDPTPSPEDIDITKRLIEGGNILGIKILDHVIIGENTYLSFADKGLI